MSMFTTQEAVTQPVVQPTSKVSLDLSVFQSAQVANKLNQISSTDKVRSVSTGFHELIIQVNDVNTTVKVVENNATGAIAVYNMQTVDITKLDEATLMNLSTIMDASSKWQDALKSAMEANK